MTFIKVSRYSRGFMGAWAISCKQLLCKKASSLDLVPMLETAPVGCWAAAARACA